MQKTKTKIPFAVLFSVGAVLFSNTYGLLGHTEPGREIIQSWK